MKQMRIHLLLLVALLFPLLVVSQTTQTIRGQVVDNVVGIGLPGVNVVVTSVVGTVGTATDTDGRFTIPEVPLGRHRVECSYIGYENQVLPNVLVISGKQTVLQIELQEQVTKVDEVVVSATKKSEALNQMATTSVRTFSVEESERFAGSLGDVSRMATNFAGVQTANDAVNEIVIRGNSPNGLLWKLDGINIPNPNHFGATEGTAGPVSMLNNNVLSNSDFYTGAFPSEYGNATSGVFDLRMRNGNSEKYEFLGQVGFGGFEFGVEGPLSVGKNASFIINYRYSTLAAMAAMGFPMSTGTAIPYYQDLTSKFTIPTENAGTFSVIALGGLNSIEFLGSERDTAKEEVNLYQQFESDLISENNLAVLGVSHKYIFSPTLFYKATLATTHSNNHTVIDSIGYNDRNITPWYRGTYQRQSLQFNLFLSKKINSRNRIKIGSDNDFRTFDIMDSVYVAQLDRFETTNSFDGNMFIVQPYIAWQHRFTDYITLNTGVHGQFTNQNSAYAVEPRLGLEWQMTEKDKLSFGFGIHSQVAPTSAFNTTVELSDGSLYKPNTDLGFTDSYHYVIGYDHNFSSTFRIKSEVYYQQIQNALVDNAEANSYSMLNAGSMTYEVPDSLVNGGEGYNTGIELTIEKFLDRGFYFLNTVSLYDSKYKGSDGVLRNTAFNSQYVVNVLGGKEFDLNKNPSSKSRNFLSFDVKVNYAGGKRYSPIDLEKTYKNQAITYDSDKAYEEQLNEYLRADLRIGYKSMGEKFTHEWGLDLQNVLNVQNEIGMRYNSVTGEVEKQYQIGFMPMILYRVNF